MYSLTFLEYFVLIWRSEDRDLKSNSLGSRPDVRSGVGPLVIDLKDLVFKFAVAARSTLTDGV